MLALSVIVVFAVLATPSHGYWGYGGCCGCQETWCAWSATWHATNDLDTPLRPYYIPRDPGCCNREANAMYGGGCGCGAYAASGTIDGAVCGNGYPGVGLEPVRFERLGQVPNDMDLGGLPPPGQRSQ